MDRQPAPGRSFYTISPKSDIDTSQTADFIKQIIGASADDLLPWTNPQEQLISWTVEASPDEVAQLKGYADIDRVIEFSPEEQPTQSSIPAVVPRAVRDIAEPAAERLSERDVTGSYAIFPRDGKDKTATDKTQQNLQQFLGADNLDPPVMCKNEVLFWAADNSK